MQLKFDILFPMDEHAAKVRVVSECVADAFRRKKHLYIFHGTSTTTREISFEEGGIVDTSDLTNILEINEREHYAIVEPNVSMQQLFSATSRYGLMPFVVTEFPAITIGGAIQGGAGESSSFKFGGVHASCEEYEVVLGNGEVVTASRIERPDLFWGMACSYGSIAVITKIKIRLMPAKKFVNLVYLPTSGAEETIAIVKRECAGHADFVDAILFDRDHGVVMVGTMVDEAEPSQRMQSFSRRRDEWFYVHVLEKVGAKRYTPDIMPLSDYLFRYNLGVFWMGRHLFEYLHIPFWKPLRQFFNKWLNAKNAARAIHAINKSQSFLVQDCCMPEEVTAKLIDYIVKNLDAYPVWLCPLASSSELDFLAPNFAKTSMVINVGIYAKVGNDYESAVKINRDLEKFASQHQGRKVLYAHQYYPEDEFWQIYDKKRYDVLRERYHATEVFPDIYQKTHVKKRYKANILSGIAQIFRSPRKLVVKKRT